MRRADRNGAERVNRIWNAVVRDGDIADGPDADDLTRLLSRLHSGDDAPHVDPTFADRTLHALIAQHPVTSSPATGLHPDTMNRSNTVQPMTRATSHSIPPPARTARRGNPKRLPGALLRPGWIDMIAVAAVVLLIFGAVLADRGQSPVDPEGSDSGFQLAAPSHGTPEVASAGDDSGGTYRGTAAHNGMNPGPGPTGKPVLAWEVDPEGNDRILGAVVSGSRAYVLKGQFAGESGGDTMSLDCLNLSDGKGCWQLPAAFGISEIVSQPTVTDGRVHVSSESGVYAFDAATGAQIWYRALGGYVSTLPPTVADGVVVTTVDQQVVVALDAATGEDAWQAGLPGDLMRETEGDPAIAFKATPSIADGHVFIKTSVGAIVAYDLETGDVAWSFDANAAQTMETSGLPVAVSDSVAYFTAPQDDGDDTTTNAVKLFALDTETGEEIWPAIDVPSVGNLAVEDSVVYYAPQSHDPQSTLMAIDATTGKPTWRTDIVPFSGSPIIADQRVYVQTAGEIVALDVETGKTQWRVYVGDVSDISVTSGLALVARPGSLLALGGDPNVPLPDEVMDLSGLPDCDLPRQDATTELSGEPTLTIPEETRLVEQVGTVYDENGNVADDQQSPYPQILVGNMPDLEPADPATTSAVRDTLLMYARCLVRPEVRANQQSAFYTDDFFRREFYDFTPGTGYRVYWPMVDLQLDEADWEARYTVSILADGRAAVTTGEASGLGQLIIFANVDGTWLIDEFYEVRGSYNDGSQG